MIHAVPELPPDLPAPPVLKRSFFIIEPAGVGWQVTVNRRGCLPETICCATPGEVNRVRLRLSDEHIVGYVSGVR